MSRFSSFLGSEPIEARRCWHELDRIASRCGVTLDALIVRIGKNEGVYGRAAALCHELADLGSLDRLYALTDLDDRSRN